MAAKVSILLPNLCPGGAERAMLTLAEEISARDVAVEILLMQARGALLAEVPETV